jgi:molecular chaperone HtpG
MPIPIKFGTKTEKLNKKKGRRSCCWRCRKTFTEVEVDNIINNPNPAWTKQPTDLTQKITKHSTMSCPMQFEEPLFHIHLNVDYPFNLTGILYFKIRIWFTNSER